MRKVYSCLLYTSIGNYQPAPEAVAFEIAQVRERKAAEKAERKRIQNEQSKQHEKERKAQRRAELEKQAEHDPEAVSYTHLDVYKRQQVVRFLKL